MSAGFPQWVDQGRGRGTKRASVTMLMAWLAVLAAIYFTLLYYPGVLYTDSYTRWGVALRPFRDNFAPEMSFVPAVVMAATYALTNNYASFSVLQSFLFFFSCFLVIRRMTGLPGYSSLLLTLPFLLFPLWPGYSVFHESGVGALVGLNFVLVYLLSRRQKVGFWLNVPVYLGIFAALVTFFGFRLNTVTVLPVLMYAFCRKTPVVPACLKCALLIAALLSAKYLPRALGSPEADNSGTGFAWEIAQVLRRVPNPEYDHYLDYLGDVRAVTEEVHGSIWGGFERAISFHRLYDEGTSRRVKLDYLRLAWKEPWAFVVTKLDVLSRVMGIRAPLWFVELDEDRGGDIGHYGGRLTPLRHAAFQRVYTLMLEDAVFLNRPWVSFVAAMIAYVVDRRWLRPRVRGLGLIYACAVFYYGAFCITTQSYEFRYFFPSFALLHFVVLAVTARILWRAIEIVAFVLQPDPPLRPTHLWPSVPSSAGMSAGREAGIG